MDNSAARSEKGQRPRILRWLAILTLMAAGVLPVVLLEAGLRVFDYGYPTGFFLRIDGRNAWASNERFGWRFFPPAIARTPVVSLVPVDKGDAYRIFILGESAAMGIPEPAFGFGRMLRVMLERRYPGTHFEVVNAAMTAINSHVILQVAEDSAQLQPDLFIVFAGNNEVVGPYGPGTVLAGYNPTRPLIRTGIWLNATRTGQLMQKQISRFGATQNPREWGGMAMFAGHRVTLDDPRLPAVYRNFRANLTAISRVGVRAGARVILSTIPVSLRDLAPFASVHRRGFTGDDSLRWQQYYDGGLQQARVGQCVDAEKLFREAIRLDESFADSHYQLARCLLALQKPLEAKQHFVRARDLDALRFRADTAINQSIREVAAAAGSTVKLVDAEQAFADASGNGGGTPGEDLFFEHVHFTFAGNYLLASSMLPQVEAGLPARIQQRRQGGAIASPGEVAQALAFTDWERDRSAMEMLRMKMDPPFTGQSDFERAKPLMEKELRSLREKWGAPGKFDAMRRDSATYSAALQRDPKDLEIRERLAELLAKSGDAAGAIKQYRALIDLVPYVARWHAGLAQQYADSGLMTAAKSEAESALQLDPQMAAPHFTLGLVQERSAHPVEAMAEYRTVLRVKPDYAAAYLRMGVILSRQGKYPEAVERYRQFLQQAPGSAEAENNLGFLLLKVGDFSGAVSHYREAVRLRADFPEARNNLGAALERVGQLSEAISCYREALRLRPNFPEAQRHLDSALAQIH